MSKYFKWYEDNRILTYPKDILFIRNTIEEKYGTLTCSNHKLEDLWKDFRDTYLAWYLESFMDLIEEFTYWLESQEEED